MTPACIRFAFLVLLVAAGCSRQAGKSVAGDAIGGDASIISQDYGSTVAHDPRAMTSIDVATGDLSGLANYGIGRAIVLRAGRANAAFEQPALATLDPPVVEQPGETDQRGAQTGPAASAAATENAAVASEQAPAATAAPEMAQPAQ